MSTRCGHLDTRALGLRNTSTETVGHHVYHKQTNEQTSSNHYMREQTEIRTITCYTGYL